MTRAISQKDLAIEQAVERLCARHIHQCFWLPESAIHGQLRVTYSTTSNFADATLPAALFCGPLFGSRYMILLFEQLAKSTGVRVFCIDRPGVGGSTPVPLSIRIKVWLESVTALLARLNVQHVSLFGHSAGTIYALNTIRHMRNILDPQAPYVALMCPWVHCKHSGATMLNLAAKLPVSAFNRLNTVPKFIGTHIAPSISWSEGLFSPLSHLWRKPLGGDGDGDNELAERYGTTKNVAEQMERHQTKFFFAEDSTGANEEMKLCLKLDGSGDWESCGDYEQYVLDLVDRERERASDDSPQEKFKIRVFYAESDLIIGKQGQKYFEQCWCNEDLHDAIEYQSKELPDTDHDSVLTDSRHGGLRSIFEDVARLSTAKSTS